MNSARLTTLVAATVLFVCAGVARAEEKLKSVAAPQENAAPVSKAVRLGDAELDKITAGFTFVLLDNPGHASKLKVTNGVLLCINCGFPNDTIVHTTPKGIHTTCVGAGRC
jgi:hypothetical protein